MVCQRETIDELMSNNSNQGSYQPEQKERQKKTEVELFKSCSAVKPEEGCLHAELKMEEGSLE